MQEIINIQLESNVSGYSKSFPTTFNFAKGDVLKDELNRAYLDFFSGAGALNYGHNNEEIKKEVMQFLNSDSPLHCLDMDTTVKLEFLRKFNEVILKKRELNYKVQFPGPTGTNAVEAAIKLARKKTGRSKIIAFTNSFHGMTASSLAVSGSQEKKHRYIPSQDVVFFPYEEFMGEAIDSMTVLSKMIEVNGSGVEKPAAIILETIQAEGGINVSSKNWLIKLEEFAQKNEILLIVDDIQVGCGRTGDFFSFERAAIKPDIVLLSKSISGYGLPLSVLLLKPELDIWSAGEHNGTFRANNLSLCTATKALDYWIDDSFSIDIKRKSAIISSKLNELNNKYSIVSSVRGIGLIWGIEFVNDNMASNLSKMLFESGLIIETCGQMDHVIKLLPPLTISYENLDMGLELIEEQIAEIEKSVR